jgi:hypothetical protein
MAEAWQVDGLVRQFDPDQLAAAGRSMVSTLSQSNVGKCPGLLEVSDFGALRIFCSASTVKKKLAPKAWADRISVPRFIRFDRPSAPTAKYPRILLPFVVFCDGFPVSYPKVGVV